MRLTASANSSRTVCCSSIERNSNSRLNCDQRAVGMGLEHPVARQLPERALDSGRLDARSALGIGHEHDARHEFLVKGPEADGEFAELDVRGPPGGGCAPPCTTAGIRDSAATSATRSNSCRGAKRTTLPLGMTRNATRALSP